jgi:hypothetical protein
MAHVKQLTAFANLVPQHHLNETKSQGKRLPRINTKDPPFFAVNNPLEANEATPIIAIKLRSANAYVNWRRALCARSHQLQTQVGNGFQNDIPRQAAERLRPTCGVASGSVELRETGMAAPVRCSVLIVLSRSAPTLRSLGTGGYRW